MRGRRSPCVVALAAMPADAMHCADFCAKASTSRASRVVAKVEMIARIRNMTFVYRPSQSRAIAGIAARRRRAKFSHLCYGHRYFIDSTMLNLTLSRFDRFTVRAGRLAFPRQLLGVLFHRGRGKA
jgi:hypothetical protein